MEDVIKKVKAFQLIRASCVISVVICEMYVAGLSKCQKLLKLFYLLIRHISMVRLIVPQQTKKIAALKYKIYSIISCPKTFTK